jgi:hypothetical protein
VRALAGLLAALVLVAGCAAGPKRTQADQDRDGKALAAALASADATGINFQLTETWVLTGGSVPKGKQATLNLTAGGSVKAGRAKMALTIKQARGNAQYDLVVADGYLYARPHSKGTWKRTTAMAATALYPAVLLGLLRDAVLLARSVGASSIVQVNNGFARKSVVIPASDQLEQLQAISVAGNAEQTFLKTATAEIDIFMTVTGAKLSRAEVHLLGTDPGTGEKNKVDSIANYTQAKVSDIALPTGALDVQPGDIFTSN